MFPATSVNAFFLRLKKSIGLSGCESRHSFSLLRRLSLSKIIRTQMKKGLLQESVVSNTKYLRGRLRLTADLSLGLTRNG